MTRISDLNKTWELDIEKEMLLRQSSFPKPTTMKTIFESIKKRAIEEEGLTVELTGDNIIFIKGKKVI